MLDSPLSNHFRLSERQLKALQKFGLETVRDLLWHFPRHYEEVLAQKAIADMREGEQARISARVIKTKTEKSWRKKMRIAEALVADGSATLRLVWFNQPYMANILKRERDYIFAGKIKRDTQGLYLANPLFEEREIQRAHCSLLIAVYPETRGITSRWLRFAIKRIFEKLQEEDLKDPLPEEVLKKYHLPSLKTALREIHFPREVRWAEAARKRFSFQEIFLIQLSRQIWRKTRDEHPSFLINAPGRELNDFIASLPFELTAAQRKALGHVLEDFQKPKPMSRLLEGDVGSGKTLVALLASFTALTQGLQIAYMAPTEVLARQHFEEFIRRFKHLNTKIALATSSECLKYPSKAFHGKPAHVSRPLFLKWIASGEIPIVIGTHALIQKKVTFKNLALVIIDEQHRFGINQRLRLAQKNSERIPHLLSMSATPIPRTLALTIYGDLDLTLLDEMPPGRKQVITKIIEPGERNAAYQHIRRELASGRQAYVICPRIELPEQDGATLLQLSMKAVKEEYRKLAEEIFPEFRVGILHGKMKPKEKERVMREFREGQIHLLVATSVVEVGVDVPNATIIVIEGAERFGLAQLHQLRGRVMRSVYQPYCFLFTELSSRKIKARLKALREARDGFELAEYDLKLRGPGELIGQHQWGISDIGMEAIKNIKMVEAAREEARKIIEAGLGKYPKLADLMSEQSQVLHFE